MSGKNDRRTHPEHADAPHQHEGDFADGQENDEQHPENTPAGDFAKGQERTEHRHEGEFGEGQATREHHPEDETKGTFARGQDSDARE